MAKRKSKKARQRARASNPRVMSPDLALKAVRKRQKSGAYAQTAAERKVKPTAEQKKRIAMMNGKGSADNWVDVAECHGLLSEREAEALRRYYDLKARVHKLIDAPRPAPDVLGGLQPHTGGTGSEPDEVAERRARGALIEIDAALTKASVLNVIGNYAAARDVPRAVSLANIRRGVPVLVEFFGL